MNINLIIYLWSPQSRVLQNLRQGKRKLLPSLTSRIYLKHLQETTDPLNNRNVSSLQMTVNVTIASWSSPSHFLVIITLEIDGKNQVPICSSRGSLVTPLKLSQSHLYYSTVNSLLDLLSTWDICIINLNKFDTSERLRADHMTRWHIHQQMTKCLFSCFWWSKLQSSMGLIFNWFYTASLSSNGQITIKPCKKVTFNW